MSDMLNERHAFAKLRTELEGREGRICRKYGRFGYLAWKCRSKKEQKKRTVVGNKFKVLRSHVMQCGVREVRRQEIMEEKPRCFKCREERHKKWGCSKNRERKREEKVALLCEVWKKVKEHCGVRGLSPRGAAMCMKEWTIPREVMTFVECQGCEYKNMKT